MSERDSAISDILALLKQHPDGLTVKKVSEGIGMNRMTVARYLDIMRISGYVDLVVFGQSKIYSVSERIPINDILDHFSDCIVTLDEDYNIIFGNRSFLELAGKTLDEISGRHIFDILNPSSKNFGSDLLYEFDNCEISVIKDGKKINYQLNFYKTVSMDGEKRIAVFLKDITELNEIKSKLAITEKLYDNLIKGFKSIILYIDNNGIITYTGPGSIEVLGYSPSEMNGRNIFDFISGDKRNVQEVLFLRKDNPDSSLSSFRTEFLSRDGSSVSLHMHIFPGYIDNSDYSGYQTLCTEINF